MYHTARLYFHFCTITYAFFLFQLHPPLPPQLPLFTYPHVTHSPQIGMLKCVITLYEESQRAISDSPAEKRITWTYIKTTLAHLIQKVVDCKFLVSCWLMMLLLVVFLVVIEFVYELILYSRW